MTSLKRIKFLNCIDFRLLIMFNNSENNILTDNQPKNNQVTGNIGLFYSCFLLSKLGWNVMPTSRNAAGIDLIIYSQDSTKKLALQIKTVSKSVPIPLGNNIDKLIGDFLIIVSNANKENPDIYIFAISDVKLSYHSSINKDGKNSYWFQPTAYRKPELLNNWDLIGKGY